MPKPASTPGPTPASIRREWATEHGIDGIISFRSMLLDIIERVEINKSYGKSDTLQVIRILKNYDLLKDAQLDLLSDRPGSSRRPAKP